MSTVSPSTEILAERVRFDIIGKTESGHELRTWTDGDRVVWQDDEGRSGYMPAMLFRLAAHQLAHYCEDTAMGDPQDDRHDDFLNCWSDSMSQPVDLAMAHPYWAQPDHEANHLRFGFASLASNMGVDAQPDGLKPRGDYRMTKEEAVPGSFHDRCLIVEDRRFESNGETSSWWSIHSPDRKYYLDENGGGWKPNPQVMAGCFMSETSARKALNVAPCPPGVEPTAADWEAAGQVHDSLFEEWYKTFEGSWHPPKAVMAAAFHAGMRRLKSRGEECKKPEPDPGVDARTDDGRFISGTGFGGERR